ncbi:hypothetical protein GGX14DRAFT_399893 [Mycena pura]|uniref:Uncharacterized protein n=1 Tax=Mycena pura TaxID=153505 RepID=A0AAD6V325_9AGAR|nr:hypothetical protein GGX14DRAFT_399893 [Mycena pura]
MVAFLGDDTMCSVPEEAAAVPAPSLPPSALTPAPAPRRAASGRPRIIPPRLDVDIRPDRLPAIGLAVGLCQDVPTLGADGLYHFPKRYGSPLSSEAGVVSSTVQTAPSLDLAVTKFKNTGNDVEPVPVPISPERAELLSDRKGSDEVAKLSCLATPRLERQDGEDAANEPQAPPTPVCPLSLTVEAAKPKEPTVVDDEPNADETTSLEVEIESPLSSPSPSINDVGDDLPDIPDSIDTEPLPPRKSSRLQAALAKKAESRESSPEAVPVSHKKRKAGTRLSQPRPKKPRESSPEAVPVSHKKRKAGTRLSQPPPKKPRLGLDVGLVMENLSVVEENPPKGYRPDGYFLRKVDLELHLNSEHAERPMLEGLQQSMNATDARCTKDGKRFRHHVHGILPTGPPGDDEFDLYVIDLDDWHDLDSTQRVALWGTGCDIFIRSLVIADAHNDIGARLRLLHGLDQPMEVQVPGLREPPMDDDDNDEVADYQQINRRTTLRTFLKHAEQHDGIVLNALKLPSTHIPQPNPLAGSGLDLEDIAFRQTSGLPSFRREALPIEQLYWEIVGTAHTVTIGHYDPTGTRITVQGPGEKLWMRRRRQNIEDAYAFHTWDPDKPDFVSGSYEGVVLPAGGGTLLMQSKEHIVVGLAPEECETTLQTNKLRATLVTGGHFYSASTIRPSLCIHLHLVMMEHVLTNVEHDGQWKIFVRICAFWLDVTQRRPYEDRQTFAAYIPHLSEHSASGWLDIVCLATVVVLATSFDRRYYCAGVPDAELAQREEVCKMYKNWRQWFAQTYTGTMNGKEVNWEADVFSPLLLHLAGVLLDYHSREAVSASSQSDVLLSFPNGDLRVNVRNALEKFQKGLGSKLDGFTLSNTKFFLFDGSEIQTSQQ